MNKVRIGIIGMGNMGKYHADYLLKGEVAGAQLSAVCSTSPQKLEAYKDRAEIFSDGVEMIKSGSIDAVLIATPHYQHTSLGICAFEQGVHVMVEKPISAHKADGERLIEASSKHPDIVFGAMFQLRTEPRYLKIKKLIDDGELGEIVRINWIITDWYRTEAYYASGGWRATWKGEGGGVLLNQCLHQLDALQWLVGMPSKVRSFAQLGRFHDIEVEDNVTAYLEYPNGATGVFISSTGEAPGSNRFEIAGTRGKLVLENDQIQFTRNENCMIEHSKTSKIGFSKPEVWNVNIPFDNATLPHAILMRNFVNAIREGEELIAPGTDGLNSVELANVLLYSSLVDQSVEMPMDGAAFEAKLNTLIKESTHEKKVVEVSSEDFASSFNR
ncbi:MAG TPA: oxidoreductase [Verrucomicrobiales bacterium]|nr:Gfo/Idh/MocA family oxidoreductase [Verrucomicrobiae bacterium]RZO73469.1 MAG: Gfo/Idh/MocA family oxidoreductase [Limisphaerales bacterium]HAO66502.1 oxidoreductase [Verrucomicrobiales bacterium]HAW00703.1 oxidoreductase [Verrucomicrobiales bacterium]HBP55473.1 oxidoreductase [Verrucomicrobiales bacterium]|tara:strand:- start:23 stop:1180 length:1158 start_codon:yes stop_codon:yes gene_type:complete